MVVRPRVYGAVGRNRNACHGIRVVPQHSKTLAVDARPYTNGAVGRLDGARDELLRCGYMATWHYETEEKTLAEEYVTDILSVVV